jgi:hypothetical protein
VSGQHHAPSALYPEGKDPRVPFTGNWVDPTARLDAEGRGKVFCICFANKKQRYQPLDPNVGCRVFQIYLRKQAPLNIIMVYRKNYSHNYKKIVRKVPVFGSVEVMYRYSKFFPILKLTNSKLWFPAPPHCLNQLVCCGQNSDQSN